MSFIYWAIKRQLAHRRRTRDAMREMRRSGYVAAYHDMLPGVKKRNWNAL